MRICKPTEKPILGDLFANALDNAVTCMNHVSISTKCRVCRQYFSMATVNRLISLPGGGEMPRVGLGTWTVWGEQGNQEKMRGAVAAAIDSGFRHIDCAWIYGNEECIGDALQAKIQDGTVTREDMFITTKLWDTHHNPALVRMALEDSLRRLKIPYVDMYLVHWPTALQDGDFISMIPRDSEGNLIFTRYNQEDVWKAMEECQQAGLTRHIGLSNFNSKQITQVMDNCTIKPANLQIEISPYFSNERLVAFCKANNIVVTAYAPLGAPSHQFWEAGPPHPLEDPLLKEIAAVKKKSVAQVILRFHLQNGIVVVPKTVTPSRLKENIDVFDFELSEEEMQKISSLNRDLRIYQPLTIGHPDYPFDEPF